MKSSAFFLALVCLLPGTALPAEQVSGSGSEPVIAGRDLSEWREILQGLDPASVSAEGYVSGLIQLIDIPEVPWFTRRQAALTLGRIGSPAREAVPVLLRLLDNQESDRETTRLWAAKAIALLGPVAMPTAGRLSQIALDPGESYPMRATTLEALARIGAEAPVVLPTFIAILSLDDRSVTGDSLAVQIQLRLAAAEGLGLLGPASAPAIPALLSALKSDSALLRLPVVTTLGTIGPAAEISIPALADTVLFDESPEVADAAAKSLGQIGPSALPTLRQLLADPDEEVRLRAVWGLAALGSAGQETLVAALADSSPLVCVWGASSLIERQNPFQSPAVVRLLELLGDTDRHVRIKAYRSLQKVPALLVEHQQELEKLSFSDRREMARAAAGLQVHLSLHLKEQALLKKGR